MVYNVMVLSWCISSTLFYISYSLASSDKFFLPTNCSSIQTVHTYVQYLSLPPLFFNLFHIYTSLYLSLSFFPSLFIPLLLTYLSTLYRSKDFPSLTFWFSNTFHCVLLSQELSFLLCPCSMILPAQLEHEIILRFHFPFRLSFGAINSFAGAAISQHFTLKVNYFYDRKFRWLQLERVARAAAEMLLGHTAHSRWRRSRH